MTALSPFSTGQDVVALELQRVLQRGADAGLVVDHEDGGGGRRAHAVGQHRPLLRRAA
jgi:hypothetical protein